MARPRKLANPRKCSRNREHARFGDTLSCPSARLFSLLARWLCLVCYIIFNYLFVIIVLCVVLFVVVVVAYVCIIYNYILLYNIHIDICTTVHLYSIYR